MVKVEVKKQLKELTTFKVGGEAEFYSQPQTVEELKEVLEWKKKRSIPHFILGGGSNVVFSDKGFSGLVIDMREYKHSFKREENSFSFSTGFLIEEASEISSKEGFEGLHVFYGMPGTIGGALYMNARCYGIEIADLLPEIEYITLEGEIKTHPFKKEEWSYKKSPLQEIKGIALKATFTLKESKNREELSKKMREYKKDRESKGHFRYPSGGSTFKNNRTFGKPTGQIIDSLGLKGLEEGGAKVAPYHGNILINYNNATASDVYKLVKKVQKEVLEKSGFLLEPEVSFIGEFNG